MTSWLLALRASSQVPYELLALVPFLFWGVQFIRVLAGWAIVIVFEK